jgi:hypothetical protein
MQSMSNFDRGKVNRGTTRPSWAIHNPRWIVQFALLLIFWGFVPALAQSTAPVGALEDGYRQMYNLQFAGAHLTFKAWEDLHPSDPFGPTSDAAAYLFSEFDRMGILQSELFIDDKEFEKGPKIPPDPASRKSFEIAIEKSEQLADQALVISPKDENALFSKVLNRGLRSDYLALVEKKYLSSIRDMKSAGLFAEQLLTINPQRYDAYLAIGVENYIFGLKPAPVRWALRIYGAEADKDAGVARLQFTAEKGHYLRPFAQLLLAVAALRDKDDSRARELLGGLSREFPNNNLYARELSRIQ